MTITYTVKGRWPFPLDMLRHDDSYPATPQDVDLIDMLSAPHMDVTSRGVVEVRLKGDLKPNTARWESFGWSVPGDTEYYAWKERDRRLHAEETLINNALAKLTPEERELIEARMRAAEEVH